jgi:hypothetical protein
MRAKKYKTSRIITRVVLVMFIANSSCQMQQKQNINLSNLKQLQHL